MRLTDEQIELIATALDDYYEIHPHLIGAKEAVAKVFDLAEGLIGIDVICGHVDGSPFKYGDEE